MLWRKVLKRGSVEEIKKLLAQNKGLAQSVVDGTGGCLGLHLVSKPQYCEAAQLLL